MSMVLKSIVSTPIDADTFPPSDSLKVRNSGTGPTVVRAVNVNPRFATTSPLSVARQSFAA